MFEIKKLLERGAFGKVIFIMIWDSSIGNASLA